MAKGKWQKANGRKGNLKFALCHLPFAIVSASFGKSERQSRLPAVCLCLVFAVCGASPLGAQSTQVSSVRPPILRDVGIDQKLNQQIPLDLGFHDETGKAVRLGDYFGQKPVILSLVYYDCPMLCTMVLNGLLESLKQLKFNVGDQFNVVTASFDPTEKPSLAAAKKAVYVGLYGRPGANENWHFLTGDEKAIRRLTQAVGFRYNYDPATKQYVHATGIMVLTPQGRLARYFYGIKYPAGNLRLGLVEASQGKIGSPVDEILLYCCQYDPQTGKYSLIISRAIKVAAGVTVLCLGTMILVLFRGGQQAAV
jgi:protein SCO1